MARCQEVRKRCNLHVRRSPLSYLDCLLTVENSLIFCEGGAQCVSAGCDSANFEGSSQGKQRWNGTSFYVVCPESRHCCAVCRTPRHSVDDLTVDGYHRGADQQKVCGYLIAWIQFQALRLPKVIRVWIKQRRIRVW